MTPYLGILQFAGAAYLVMSLICFASYALDKSAARRGDRRTPESTLLILGLLGGWPGAVLAQQWLRHKTVKQPFRSLFWCTVAANLGLLLWLTVLMWGVDISAAAVRHFHP
jgi:uncharacterized membrane protein YsdA (DUF1294 family)